MSIQILYNGSVYYREEHDYIGQTIEDFVYEIGDDFNADSLLVYEPLKDMFYIYDTVYTDNFNYLPEELNHAAYELMGIEGRTK